MVAQDPHPGSLHRQGAGPAVRDRGGRLHVLPGRPAARRARGLDRQHRLRGHRHRVVP